ncbi:helix-turn-helix domain-containing protein [Microbacterium imperiale]|nr:helix-turn-helix transcriptional regulator [Microbacterium imperiale]MBP2420016.1 transcriptional regulator with XRE-family HTH domain [Microbacterium imperiale]MDS0198120.1 helix-turn-helix domain-containing protein [Microbacterium imperiale]
MTREIISRLRGQIARFDVNQTELAVLCDVSQSQFSKIIRGTRPMSLDQLVVICDALAIDLGELTREVEDFLANRDLGQASPIVYVEEGARIDPPYERSDDWLDDWGKAARQRLHPQNVVRVKFGVGPPAEDELDAVARPTDPEPTDEQ